jgi:hypothetical protein
MGSIGAGCGTIPELLPRPWRVTGGRSTDLDYDNDRKTERINNADFQIKTDSYS